MPQSTQNIAALIGSRICHDLISPVGAVANGLELLEMTGSTKSPEMSLVTDSAENATARLRFFRLAFGAASEGQQIAAQEVGEILSKIYDMGRTDLRWTVRNAQDRMTIKTVLLALLCVEQALPGKGRITISLMDRRWSLRAEAPRLMIEPRLWSVLDGADPPDELPPASVQFALLPAMLDSLGRKASMRQSDTVLELAF